MLRSARFCVRFEPRSLLIPRHGTRRWFSKKGSSGNDGGEEGSLAENIDQLQKALSVIENSLMRPSPKLDKHPEVVALPVTRRPLFPGFYKALTVREPSIVAGIKNMLAKNKPYVGVFLALEEEFSGDVICQADEIHHVGVLAQIHNVMNGPNGALTLLVYPHKRVEMTRFLAAEPQKPVAEITIDPISKEVKPSSEGEAPVKDKDAVPANIEKAPIRPPTSVPRVFVEAFRDLPYNKNDKRIQTLAKELVATLNEIALLNPLIRDQVQEFLRSLGNTTQVLDDPDKLADFTAAISDGQPLELQSVLAANDIKNKLRQSLLLAKKELVTAQLQGEVSKDVDRLIGERDREYFLQQKLKTVQKELGVEVANREKLLEKFRKRVQDFTMPAVVKKVFDEEMGKLSYLKPAAQEFILTSNYLDWLTQIPWGKSTSENLDLQKAQTILDEDHYGLKDVKDRILEFIAVGIKRKSVHGKIICLHGPPGVGKTSVGRSIARALNREFYRFSVGGLYDVAEIKGHRRTYVGAMPGKLVQALKKVGTENPLILIDEVDKIGRGGHNGDPSSALLEVLDPEQNNAFLDHYMDVPIDLSKVLFVCTSNVLETIPGPLRDRMEVITLSGYVAAEKKMIASQYLIPQAQTASGVDATRIKITDDIMDTLIHSYCRESGVRNLKKHVEKIFRKAALKIVEKQETATDENFVVDVTKENLKDFVGNPVFTSDRLYEKTPTGVIMGLAYSSMGGSSLYIESVLRSPRTENSAPSFSQTGNMGDVMKESSSIAYSFAKSLLTRHDPQNVFFSNASIHMHVPEGATPKDGPSAGIAMTTSLVSLALNQPVKLNVAMTGEISLTGKVLKIGGVKEKVMAAKRSGVEHVILPKDNQTDYEKLEDYIRSDLSVHFVDHYDQVFELLFESK